MQDERKKFNLLKKSFKKEVMWAQDVLCEEKNYQQFLNQLGPDSLASLCKLAESCHFNLSSQGVQGDIVGDSRATDSANDDGIPELVENSEAASEKKEIAKASSATTEKLAQPKITAAPPHSCSNYFPSFGGELIKY
ncbi:461_t:CDS:2 [Entrophospora sp. SA101]|nr:461_t:CDS:2 [Entrophospora sp. SA101]